MRCAWKFIFDISALSVSLVGSVLAIYSTVYLVDAGLLPRDAFTILLSISSPLSSALLFISPLPAVMEAVTHQNVMNLPTQVFKSQAMCNVLGISYGVKISNVALAATNLFGLAAQIVWLCADHYVREKDTQWLRFSMLMSVLLNIGIVVCVAMPLDILGTVITVFNVILFASPLSKIGTVLRTRNASSMPLMMTIMMCVCNGSWILYASMIQDSVVLLPSLLGYLLSIFQVMVIAWCHAILPFDLLFLLMFCFELVKVEVSDAGSGQKELQSL